MDNIFVQTAVGLIPAMLLFLLLSIFSKKSKVRNILLTIGLFLLVGGLAIPSLISEITNQSEIAQSEVLGLVYAIADEGSPEIAEDLLEELRADYKAEYALAAARLAAKKGDYQLSKALYLKSGAEENQSEYAAVVSLSEAENQYYGLSDDTNAAEVHNLRIDGLKSVSGELRDAFSDEVPVSDDNVYGKVAKHVVYADNAHKAYLSGGDFDEEGAKKQLRRFNTLLEENPEFLEVTGVRLARLKLQILCSEYKQIAQGVSEESDYNELLIVSELYLNNDVKQSNFSDEFSSDDISFYDTVYQKLNDIYNKHYQDKPREERNAAKAQLRALKTIINNPALAKMQQGLSEYAETQYALDASKVYLQMAKIEHSLGNEIKASEYIDRSIDTVGDCEDDDYTLPMYELVGIIADKDNPERLKSVAEYVEQVLDNNMTVKLADTLPDEVHDESEDNSLSGDFSSQMQTYVNQKRMSVNIVNVDTTNFESNNTVKATVNISNNLYTSVDELKEAISLQDCGIDIEDFTVEKVDYTGANILLCVDVSGSMSSYGKIDQLKDAIKLFADDKAPIENIALVTFNSDIVNEYPFGITIDELNFAADSIIAGGGTNMYNALAHSLEKFTKNTDEINFVILMSDGLDGFKVPTSEIEEYIGRPASEKGITVYSIGFGNDADSTYLNALAAVTGGTYLYANEPTVVSQLNQLSEFFNGLRAQVLNQYTVTFKPKDTLSYSRELQITVDDGLDSDKVTYYLGGGEDSMIEPGFGEESPIFMEGKAINGLNPRMLFKSGRTLSATIMGEGFDAEDNIRVSLKGKSTGVEWNLGNSFIDPNSLSVTIPAGIGVDVYDVYVTVNGKTAVLPKGLSIFTQGSEKITDFGQYRFVSYMKQTKGDTISLSGCVTMNGWLNFNGDIALSGDPSSGRITLKDYEGASVRYHGVSAEGLASTLGELGLPVALPPLGEINLYDDSEYEKQAGDVYVEAFPLNALDLGRYFGFTQIEAKLYPNRASFETGSLAAKLPFATKVLNNKADIFSFDVETGVTVSSKKIGCELDLEYNASDSLESTFSPLGFGNMPIYVSPRDTEIHIDTMANKYEFNFAVKMAFVDGKMGLRMKWDNAESGNQLGKHSNGLVPTEINIYLPASINTVVAGIPITFDDFFCGIEDIDTSKSIVYWTLVGGMDVSAAKLTAVPGLGGLENWIGDVSVVKFDEAKLSIKLGDCYFKADTKVKIFEDLDMGSLMLEVGKFPYTSTLLGMDNEPVAGMRFVGTMGPDWQFGESSLKAQVTGELDLINRFFGIQGKSEFDIRFKVWVISIGASLKGELAFGIRRTSDGTAAFVVRANPKLPMVGEITWPKNVAGKL